ncbi:MAG: DUF6452 family protein [Flavobacteriaceae bacterium]
MKRFIFPIILLFLGFGAFSGCEKDDICSESTPTTPAMVIDFYEYLNPSVEKTFLKLEIIETEIGQDTLVFENTNTIELPLRTDAQVSTYKFILTYTNINTQITNEDLLEFRYTKNDIYISRACGYKSNFSLLESDNQNPNPILTDPAEDDFWIKELIVKQPEITNENETHLDLLF